MKEVRIAAYGGGVNSTAMIVELTKRGVKLDAILFADTGGEKKETYSFIKRFSKWLVKHGQPAITIVKKVTRDGYIETLEENCLRLKMIPSIAFGYKTCSHKFKIQPQEKWCNNFSPCIEAWERGDKVIKYIGFDFDEKRRIKPDDEKYHCIYPLVDWEINRAQCKAIIFSVGLCIPPKSSCFFCPNCTKKEILSLNPSLQKRAIAMEDNAQENLIEMKGLGRRYAWKDLIQAKEKDSDDFDDLELYPSPCECID